MELIIGDFRVRTLDDLNLVVEEHRDVLEKDKKTLKKYVPEAFVLSK